MFEAGLRTQVIHYVLNQICGGKLRSKANDAARLLIERGAKLLLVEREQRTDRAQATEHPKQRVRLMDAIRVTSEIKALKTAAFLILPVGNLYSRLKANLNEIST